jgi:hypothetical protein
MRTKSKTLPAVEFLLACFDYDPGNGELRWRIRPRDHFSDQRICDSWNTNYASTVAGTVTMPSGYLTVGIRKVTGRAIERYFVHRIIWKMVTGEDPAQTIDHADGDQTNNRWPNLRSATASQQQWNQPRNAANTSGYKGVYRSRGRWRAMIRTGGPRRSLGTYSSPQEAAAAYEAAARRLHGEFCCVSRPA